MQGISGLGQSKMFDAQHLSQVADKLINRKDADGNGTLTAEELDVSQERFDKFEKTRMARSIRKNSVDCSNIWIERMFCQNQPKPSKP